MTETGGAPPDASRPRGTIRVGTAGWDYPDWDAIVYPRPRPRGFDPLAMLAEILDTIEVNATFYRTPSRSTVASWARRVAAHERFAFTVKLPRIFTHAYSTRARSAGLPAPGEPGFPAALDEEESRFRDAIEPLADAGRLGAVLAQFPQSFHPDPQGSDWLESLLGRLQGLPLAVEFRHAGWGGAETLATLRRYRAAFCNIDQPRLDGTLPPTAHVTSSRGYVRLHGRNEEAWFLEGAGRDRRYDYLYEPQELAPWIQTIHEIAEEGADTYVITNNHFRGKATVNALQIQAALSGGRIDVPDTLMEAYPQLNAIAKPPRAPRLF